MKKLIPFLVILFFILTRISCFSQGTYHYELLDNSFQKIMEFSSETIYPSYANTNYFTFKTEGGTWHIYSMKGRKINDTISSANQYSEVYPPNEDGHCIVKQSLYPNPDKFGVIDTSGKIIIPLAIEAKNFKQSFTYSDGMYKFYKDDKIGFLNKQGKEVLSPTLYDWDKTYFSDGFALVWDDVKKFPYFVNKEGKPALQGAYKPLNPFSEGLANVSYTNDLGKTCMGYIDKKGIMSIKLDTTIASVGNFKNGMAYVITKANKLGFIDKTGKLVIPCIYDGKETYELIHANSIIAAKDGKFFTLTKTGEVIAEFNEQPYFLEGGYAQIGSRYNWGIINVKNQVVREANDYDNTIFTKNNFIICPRRTTFEEYMALKGRTDIAKKLPISFFTLVSKNGTVSAPILNEPLVINDTYFYQLALDKKYGLASIDGKILFEKMGEIITYSRKHCVVKENNAIAAVNTKGQYSIKSGMFTAIGPLVNTYTWAKKGTKYFSIDSLGTIVAELTNIDTVDGTFNKYGIALAKKTNSKWGYINYKAEFITPTEYYHALSYNDDTWRTTDNYADNTLLKAHTREGDKVSDYKYTYYTAAGKEFKNKFFDKNGLNYNNPTLSNLDNDEVSFYLTGTDLYGGGIIVNTDGEKLSKNIFGRFDKLVVNKDTLTVYYERRVDYTDRYETNEASYLIVGKELRECTTCKKQTVRYAAHKAREMEYYKKEMINYKWNELAIKQSNTNDGSYYLSNKKGKKIKYSDFEVFKTTGSYALLESDLKTRSTMYNERFVDNSSASKSKGRTMSARWISETQDYLSLFETFLKAFNSYKDSRTNENAMYVNYWYYKLKDQNTTILNVLSHSNDGSMPVSEQANYKAIAEKKSQELIDFHDKFGKSDITVLDALMMGLVSGLGGR